MATEGRAAQLDGLRALAVLAVIAQHSWAGPNGRYGLYGVYLFFVLSGFLITRILLNARGREGALRASYIRRSLRIFPIYYGILIVALAFREAQVRQTAGWLFTYTENLYNPFTGNFALSPVNHLWSLAVEEQFYLFWPTLVLTASRRALPWLFVAAIMVGPISRAAMFVTGHNLGHEVTTSCLDSLGLGAWLALSGHDTTRWARWAGAVGATALLVIAGFLWLGMTAVGVIGEPLAFSLFSVWLVEGGARGFAGLGGRLLASRPLVAIGTVSYGMYLYHPFVVTALHIDFQRGPFKFLAYTMSTLVVSAVSWHAIERPIQRLKDRFPYTRSATRTAQA